MAERQLRRLLHAIEHDGRSHVPDAPMRQENLIENARQSLEIRHHQLDQIVRLTGQRIGLLNLLQAADQLRKCLPTIRGLRRQTDLNEYEHIETYRLVRERGVV